MPHISSEIVTPAQQSITILRYVIVSCLLIICTMTNYRPSQVVTPFVLFLIPVTHWFCLNQISVKLENMSLRTLQMKNRDTLLPSSVGAGVLPAPSSTQRRAHLPQDMRITHWCYTLAFPFVVSFMAFNCKHCSKEKETHHTCVETFSCHSQCRVIYCTVKTKTN